MSPSDLARRLRSRTCFASHWDRVDCSDSGADQQEAVWIPSIKRKHFALTFSCVVALFMSFFMSFFLTMFNVGFSSVFLSAWMRSFGLGFAVALPISIVFIPLIRKVLESFVEE